MARREWAHVKGQKTPKRLGETDIEFCARVAKAEHARSVRIVKAAIANEKKEMADDPHNEGLYEYTIDKLRELLTALQRGRGGKG